MPGDTGTVTVTLANPATSLAGDTTSTSDSYTYGGGRTGSSDVTHTTTSSTQSTNTPDGAIILKQEDGQSIRAYPNLDISKDNNTLNIAFTQIDLIGTTQSLTGSDTVGFSIDLIYIDSQKYSIGTGDKTFRLSFNTTYGEAWYRYFDQLCRSQGLVNNTDYVLTSPVAVDGSTNGLTTFSLVLKNCNELSYNRAYVSMTMLTS
jgi:hypothetical protein